MLDDAGRDGEAALGAAEVASEYVRDALSFVPLVARRFVGRGLSFDELVAAGNLGLVQAALRFDPLRQVRFPTYAAWWIRKSILEALGHQGGAMRVPRYQYDRLKSLRDARAAWIARSGCTPSAQEAAGAAGFSLEEVHELDALTTATVSLDQSLDRDDGRPVKELIEDPGAGDPDVELMRADLSRRLRSRLTELGQRERQVLTLRYGLADGAPKTLRETGERLGLSRERVRQVELRALHRLRDLV